MNCENCKFYKENKQEYLFIKNMKGECHRYPPNKAIGGDSGGYPLVGPYDWCGEYKVVEG